MYRIFTLCDLRLQVFTLIKITSMCVSAKYQCTVTNKVIMPPGTKKLCLFVCLFAFLYAKQWRSQRGCCRYKCMTCSLTGNRGELLRSSPKIHPTALIEYNQNNSLLQVALQQISFRLRTTLLKVSRLILVTRLVE